ncbi:MAG: type I restriction endonuclease subunit R [Cyanobacteria bacterium P01_F01_bin.150]
MTATLAISKRIVSLEQLKQRWPNLVQAEDDSFFPEWRDNLPTLTEEEKTRLNQYQNRYQRHRERGELSEGTVKLLLLFPLLELAGFYDDPFFISAESISHEENVELVIEDRNETLRGRIDTLVIRSDLWVLLVESKRLISFASAIPQALADMLGNPNPDRPVYAMVTDGDLFMFIKLLAQDPPRYDFSDPVSLLVPRRDRLYDILRILKQVAQTLVASQ